MGEFRVTRPCKACRNDERCFDFINRMRLAYAASVVLPDGRLDETLPDVTVDCRTYTPSKRDRKSPAQEISAGDAGSASH